MCTLYFINEETQHGNADKNVGNEKPITVVKGTTEYIRVIDGDMI